MWRRRQADKVSGGKSSSRVNVENLSCRCGVVLDKFWLCNGGVSEVWLGGGKWRVFRGPLRTVFSPSFLPSAYPLNCPPFLPPFIPFSSCLFPPCQSPSMITLSCQLSSPNMLFILLFYCPSSSFLPFPFYSSSLTHPYFFLSSNVSYLS